MTGPRQSQIEQLRERAADGAKTRDKAEAQREADEERAGMQADSANGEAPPWVEANTPPDEQQRQPSGSRRSSRLHGQWARQITLNTHHLYLIKRLIPANAFVQMFGGANCGKSAVAVDIACHLGSAMATYRSRRIRPVAVAIFALENPASCEARIVAWCLHHRIDRNKLKVYVVSGTLNLLNHRSTDGAIDVLAQASVQAREQFGLIVIDTQARATPGANENASEAMSAMIDNCDRIRSATGATVALIHHAGKNTLAGARGHSNQFGAVDVSLEVADRTVTIRKVRDGATGEKLPFDLIPIEIGTDEDGDTVTSVVAVAADGNRSRKAATTKLTGYAATAFKSLQEVIADKGERPGISTMPSGVRAVQIASWKTDFLRRYGKSGDRSEDSGDRTFRRVREKLAGGQTPFVGISDPWVWIWTEK
jgi:hypothetical protein